MNDTHKRINEHVVQIQKLIQQEIDENTVKYERYMLIDFSDKLSHLHEELLASLSD